MTEADTTDPIGAGRSSRRRWGCAILSALVFAGLVFVSLQIYLKFRETSPAHQLSEMVEGIEKNLRDRAADGVLTDEEIMRSTSRSSDGDPKVRQDDAAIHFDTEVHAVTSSPFGSSGANGCYTFTITKPLSSSSTVMATKLASCDSLVRGG